MGIVAERGLRAPVVEQTALNVPNGKQHCAQGAVTHICYPTGLQSSSRSEEPFFPSRSLLNNGLYGMIIHFSTTPKNMSVFPIT